jgi:hypothetical protein
VRFPNPPHNVYGPYITSTAVIKRKRTTGNSYQYSWLIQIYHKCTLLPKLVTVCPYISIYSKTRD